MSDIGIRFTWWDVVLWMLALYFWPLTLALLLSGYWWLMRRASRLARIAFGVSATLWLASGSVLVTIELDRVRTAASMAAEVKSRQTTLAHPGVVEGRHVPAGTVITRTSADPQAPLDSIDLPAVTTIDGMPLIGRVSFLGGGINGQVTLAHDARVAGLLCSTREPVVFSLGSFSGCFLAGTARIKGVPCSGHLELQPGLRCTLAADYGRFGYRWRGDTEVTDYDPMVWFRIGSLAPNLIVLGAQLRPESVVQFAHGRLAGIDLRAAGMPYRGCNLAQIVVRDGRPVGSFDPPCTALLASEVLLPADAIRAGPS